MTNKERLTKVYVCVRACWCVFSHCCSCTTVFLHPYVSQCVYVWDDSKCRWRSSGGGAAVPLSWIWQHSHSWDVLCKWSAVQGSIKYSQSKCVFAQVCVCVCVCWHSWCRGREGDLGYRLRPPRGQRVHDIVLGQQNYFLRVWAPALAPNTGMSQDPLPCIL